VGDPLQNGAGVPRRVAVVTGTRAEFGLLRPVMHAVRAHPDLELLVVAAGSHLIQPGVTFREVKREFDVADSIPMQVAGRRTRLDDAEALGRGISRFARSFGLLEPGWAVVLGDRIEAFAAASAASVAGIAVAHIHGGDRAEGVADEAMRHAITKLAHLHLPATEASAERIRRMGERPERVHVIGSPAIDGLRAIEPIDDDGWKGLGAPEVVFLLHPIGRLDEEEEHSADRALSALEDRRVLALMPNHDPGRDGIVRALEARQGSVKPVDHLPRARFVGVLRRLAAEGGVLVGNSSCGLIEAAALGLPVVDLGLRQGGRERAGNAVHDPGLDAASIRDAVERAGRLRPDPDDHPYGDGRAGERVAALLARIDPHDRTLLRKRNMF